MHLVSEGVLTTQVALLLAVTTYPVTSAPAVVEATQETVALLLAGTAVTLVGALGGVEGVFSMVLFAILAELVEFEAVRAKTLKL